MAEVKAPVELVAHSPYWCRGEYHKPDCICLPKKHKKPVPLESIIGERRGTHARYPCDHCRPSTGGLTFAWYTLHQNGIHYHLDRDCIKLRYWNCHSLGKPIADALMEKDVTFCLVCCRD